jgi:hypothetical protein
VGAGVGEGRDEVEGFGVVGQVVDADDREVGVGVGADDSSWLKRTSTLSAGPTTWWLVTMWPSES